MTVANCQGWNLPKFIILVNYYYMIKPTANQFVINTQFLSKIAALKKQFKKIQKLQAKKLDKNLYNIISKVTLDDNSLTSQLRVELYSKILEIFGNSWQEIPETAIKKSISELSKLILERYVEPKPEYQKSFSRNYGNLIIKEWLKQFLTLRDDRVLDASKSAVRIFMDMNGVGKLNLIGKPFHSTSKAIGRFVELLKNCETAKQIKAMGLEYKLSIDGGDEFSIFIYDPKFKFNVYAILPEIKYSLLMEMEATNINAILDEVKLERYFDKDQVPIIHLSSSLGYTSFWQLVNTLTVDELTNKNRESVFEFLCLRWFDLSYSEANKFKLEYKQTKIAENPKLYSFLFTK
jgi:hypothetical protein